MDGSGDWLDLVLHAVALALDDDGFGVVQEAVQDGGSEGGVVVENLGPGFIGLVGGEDDGASFVALADDLEEEIGTGFVDGQISEFVDDEYGRAQEFLEFDGESVGDLSGGEGVDDFDGSDKAYGVSCDTCGVPQGRGKMGLTQPHSAQENDVGPGFDKAESEEILDLGTVDFPGPTPLELFQSFEGGKAGGVDAALKRGLVATDAFRIEEAGEIVDVSPGVAGGIDRKGSILIEEGVEVESLELLFETLLVGFHRREGGRES